MTAPEERAARLAAVRALILAVPLGQATTYGEIGDAIGVAPRAAGRLVSQAGEDVPWWRVVFADGTPAACHGGAAAGLLRAEGVPFRGERVDWRALAEREQAPAPDEPA